MVKKIIATLCILWAMSLTGCMPQGGYNIQGPTPTANKPWNCNPPKQRYRGGPIRAYCSFIDENGLERDAWLTEKDYDHCRRRRHCHRHRH